MATAYNLHLKGYVGGSDFDRNAVDKTLAENSGKPVNVLIDSLGGTLATVLSISAAFKNHGNVNVHFIGLNASAATIASLGATHISIDKNAMYLVHKCSTALHNQGCDSAMLVQAQHCAQLARHFATLIAIRIAEQLGLPFFEDGALDNQGCGSAMLKQVWHCAHLALDFAPSKHRVGTVFTANNIPPHRNIIVFDDFVTTGQTLVSMQNLLVSLGKNCTFFAGINNKL